MGIQIYYIHWSFQRGGEKGIKERWERCHCCKLLFLICSGAFCLYLDLVEVWKCVDGLHHVIYYGGCGSGLHHACRETCIHTHACTYTYRYTTHTQHPCTHTQHCGLLICCQECNDIHHTKQGEEQRAWCGHGCT